MPIDFQYFQSFLLTNKRTLEYVTDKSKSCESIMLYMLSRLQKMFRYEGLPDTIPRQYLENYLLMNGSCVIAKDISHPEDDNLYAFVGAAGGPPDVYYRPTRYMVANPGLKTSNEYYISTTDKEHSCNAVLMRNDTMWQGLYPMMARYASLIAENLLTVRTADVMLRVLALITAPDDSSRLAADQFLKDIEQGHLASIAENRFLDGIRMQNPPSNNGSYLTQFIELHQYLVGSFYNEIGLNANYNMKREALSESETGLNDDSLMPLCEDMLRCRQEDIARVNEMFGTSIQVFLDSSWLENEIERLLSLQKQSTEASSQLDNPAPLEVGMEDVKIEVASQLGAGMEDADGNGSVGDESTDNERAEEPGNESTDNESTEEGMNEGNESLEEDSNESGNVSGELDTGLGDGHSLGEDAESSENDGGTSEEENKAEQEEGEGTGNGEEGTDAGTDEGKVEVNIEININGEENKGKEEEKNDDDSSEDKGMPSDTERNMDED